MTDRWCTSVRARRGRWAVELTRKRAPRRKVSIIVSWHDTRSAAEVARAAVRLDPAAHWRQPKRGPAPKPVSWSVEVRDAARGRATVSLARRERTDEGSVERKSVIATCDSRTEAEALRERVRRNPEVHWREPKADHPQARAAKQRAALRRVERERAPRVERQPEPIDGGWLLGCGLHEAERPVHPCPVCARAAELTDASLREVASHPYAGMVRKMREEAA